MKNYLFLLLLFCANMALGQTNIAAPDSLSIYKLDELACTGEYDLYELDLNNDGLKDKALCNDKEDGQELYFFLQDMKGNYHCALKSWNFFWIEDQGISEIYELNDYIVLEVYGPYSMDYTISHFIKYKDSRWILDHTVLYIGLWEEDYTRNFYCVSPQDIDMAQITNSKGAHPINPLPTDMPMDERCKSLYKSHSLDEFEARFEHPPHADMRTVKDVERYEQLLTKFPLTSSNVEQYNNIAYLAEKNEIYDEAIYLLEQITQQFPDRTVAYINLGDAYWGKEQKGDAKKAYKRYLSLMEAQNLDMDRVPARVYNRTK